MFHTILTLSYTIPAIYLFIRLWQFFIERRYKLWFLLIFSALFSMYPLSRISEDKLPASRILSVISDYLLPFFLYLFLFVLVTDILLLTNLIFKIKSQKIGQRSFRNRYFMMIISLSIIVVAAGIINFNTISITEYNITVPGRSSDLSHLRIAFVSDFHLQREVPRRFVENFVRKIRKTEADLILYGGDIVEGAGENIREYEDLLRSIQMGYGCYGVLGNHDRIRNFRDNFFTRSGIILLRDSIVTVENSFILIGRNDIGEDRISAEGLTRAPSDDLPVIMIDHRPSETDQISRTATDISFSGHTHNGQLFPINLFMTTLNELNYGHLKKADTHFFVSSGIRLWGPPVRTTGKSEIVVVDVRFE